MAFQRYPFEEEQLLATPVRGMRDISSLAAEETDKRLSRATDANERRINMQVQGANAFGQGIREGVNSFMDRKREARKDAQEEARLDRAERRADRGEEREDKRIGMSEEEFALRKPVLKAQGDTAEEVAQLAIEQGRAGVDATRAQSRLAGTQADVAEREEAWKNKSAVEAGMPGAGPTETMRDYTLRMDMEGQKANRDLALARLEEEKTGRPLRQKLAQAQIEQSMASIALTRQQTKQAAAEFDVAQEQREVEKLAAIAKQPTPEQLRSMAPYLADKVNRGEITPEKAALVVSNIQSKQEQRKLQQLIYNNADGEYQDRFARTVAARDKAENYLSAIAEMESALANNKANAMLTDDGSRERFASMLDAVGMGVEAEKIRGGADWGAIADGNNPLGLTGRMETLLAKVKASARAQMNVLPETVKADPKVQELASRINSLDSAGLQGGAGAKPIVFGGQQQQPMNAQQTPGIFPGGASGINQPILPSPNARKRMAPAMKGPSK